jgi:hypothetical protein
VLEKLECKNIFKTLNFIKSAKSATLDSEDLPLTARRLFIRSMKNEI